MTNYTIMKVSKDEIVSESKEEVAKGRINTGWAKKK